ncbi:MAG: serine/threonine protein kinase [Chloroflexi bacterium]|nr:serine/threonine protein kinase [Chloroflexota bacterium]
MSFNIGENVGPYRIIEQLGQGGMATVYKAYHAALDRYVALKVLHQAFNQDQTFTARFQREARVVAKLEHPNIVPVYDYSEHEARPYLVMKFIEGDTLKARLNRGPLTSNEIEEVVNSIGSALAYAHRQGILHRDIKPSNVMIAVDGVMYLADFGLARIAQAGESTMSSDSIMGTPQYISPEQAMGKKDLDAGTDIYSFGVMLYEMVVGQVPFSADTPFSIIHDHIYTPLPLPMKVNPHVPEPVQRVLLKSLAKDRLDRYESVEDMMRAFKEAWTEAGVPMRGTSITMPPTSLAGEPTALKTQMAGTAIETGAAKPSLAAKRFLWKWIGAGVIVVLIGCVFLAAIRSINANPPVAPTAIASVIPVTNIPPVTVQPTSLPPTGNTAPTPKNISPEVTAAQEQVNLNPGDPNAHLKLSIALWEAKEIRPAMDELAQAANLAGPNNKEFFSGAAQEFKMREAWVPAAGMYLRLVPIYRVQGPPPELENNFHESIYKAAEEKDMPLFVFFERIDNVDLTLGFVARSRYALFNGEVAEAKTQWASAEKIKPEMYEVILLHAEIEWKTGSQADAKAILLSLSSDLGAPEWIRFMAENYLKAVP